MKNKNKIRLQSTAQYGLTIFWKEVNISKPKEDIKKNKNYIVSGKSINQSENGHEFHSDTTIKNNSSEDTRQN
ncbi:hypothetical protein SOM12_01570 [Flavobacterium sp. CFBP9031]|jgi:hypothetical protein|uniref:hypothetical protein n=1 Tax=Flavobacterium sp. CFBP9031 TaxID=3096538 RepID=UPI002A6A8837|nr:hypothetical protein [Flavobacterium sp. CFBP9031]MDY0986083.1 hypothetical protein [Flavobacterium sp. CFBP9031]